MNAVMSLVAHPLKNFQSQSDKGNLKNGVTMVTISKTLRPQNTDKYLSAKEFMYLKEQRRCYASVGRVPIHVKSINNSNSPTGKCKTACTKPTACKSGKTSSATIQTRAASQMISTGGLLLVIMGGGSRGGSRGVNLNCSNRGGGGR